MTGKGLYRILDANFNRAREGLRVAEEVIRFVLNDGVTQARLKRARHDLGRVYSDFKVPPTRLVQARDSGDDVGKADRKWERPRRDVTDVYTANLQRAKEALRVLEEFSKLVDPGSSGKIKRIRFHVYQIEKRALHQLEALCDHLPRKAGGPGSRAGRGGSHRGRSGRGPAKG